MNKIEQSAVARKLGVKPHEVHHHVEYQNCTTEALKKYLSSMRVSRKERRAITAELRKRKEP